MLGRFAARLEIMIIQQTLENKPIEDIKPYRWITLKEQEQFCDFLENLGIKFDNLRWCASEWEKYRCSYNPMHPKKVQYMACGCRGRCARCSMSYASKRAEIMYQWIKMNLADKLDFDLKINQIVLTLPEKLHNMDTKLFSKIIKKFMSHFGIEAYGYCIQTRHSKDPLGNRYVHGHILCLNLRQVSQKLVQNNYYFDVQKMRDVWKDVIEKYTEITVEGDVDLHTEYASILKDKDRVLHILAYLYRYPIQDLFSCQIRYQSINYVQFLQIKKSDAPSYTLQIKELRKRVMDLIWEPKPRIVWCGLLTPTKRNLLLDLIGVSASLWLNIPRIEKMMEERSRQCRDCGCPYEVWPFDRGKYLGDNEPDIL